MLVDRLFSHAIKKHQLTIQEYADKYNIDLYKYQDKGGYYKNGEARRHYFKQQRQNIKRKNET